jgi:uncharacterized protein YlxW (UPF0749 family)
MIEAKVINVLNKYFMSSASRLHTQHDARTNNAIRQQTANKANNYPHQRETRNEPRFNQELEEIKSTTQTLTHEIGSMRKLIEDLHISVSEKDAEIIKLRMTLTDER